MRFGVALPTYPVGATVDGVVEVARAAERLGFASIWTTDHVIMLAEEAGPYADILEALTTTAYLAAVTERVTLGVSVIVVPQRNGVVLAKELATIDRLASGRLIVGVGAGWNEAEFRMLDAGARFARRGAYLDETIRLWRHLWTTPERPFAGDFYGLPGVAFAPLPENGAALPIWVGGSSVAARRRAGRIGAAWHPVGITPDDLADQLGVVAETAAAAGRPMPEIAPRLTIYLAGIVDRPATPRGYTLAGSTAELREQFGNYEQAGANEIVVSFGSPDGATTVAAMERFGAEVMPAFV